MKELEIYQAVFQESPIIVYAYVALIGAFVGSFINVVAARLPLMMKRETYRDIKEFCDDEGIPIEMPEVKSTLPLTLWGRSFCPSCGGKIPAYLNVPVLGWIFTRGRCHSCRTSISTRYPIVELATSIASVAVVYAYGITAFSLVGLVVTWVLIALVIIDVDELLLPDTMTLTLLWGLLASSIFVEGYPITVSEAVIGAIAGYMSLWAIYWLFRILTGKAHAMGYGDFKLLSAIGALVGALALPYVVLAAVLVSGVMALFVKRTVSGDSALPFGPGLAVGGWVVYLLQSDLYVFGIYLGGLL